MSKHLPSVKPREMINALERAGFYVQHSTGSHKVLKHPKKLELRVTVAYHNEDLKKKTLISIIRQAGYTVEEFLEFL